MNQDDNIDGELLPCPFLVPIVSPLFFLHLIFSHTLGVLRGFMVFCCTEHVNKAKGLLLISKDYRKWAQSPIEHFQLEVRPLRLAGVKHNYSLTRREMEIEHRYHITWYFPISVSLPVMRCTVLLCFQQKSKYLNVKVLHYKQVRRTYITQGARYKSSELW